MTEGTDRIAAERDRQIDELGYTQDHDLQHDDGDLPFAAAVLAAPGTIYLLRVEPHAAIHPEHGDGGRVEWVEPWPVGWDRKPVDRSDPLERVEELTKAGALIAAEIDRVLAGMPDLDQESAE